MAFGKLALALFLLLPFCLAKPCCPEDPEHMTFDYVRMNASYLIGNHLNETLPIPFGWWFRDTTANFYSMNGDFVIGLKTKEGRLVAYSLEKYKKPRLLIYAKEAAIDRIWRADNMILKAIGELFSGNVIIIHRPYGFS